MMATNLYGRLTRWNLPGAQEPDSLQALGQMLDEGLEAAVLLLSFTVAIFVLLIFAVRVLATIRKLPVPVDPVQMARPRGFRALMLGFSALMAPLVATSFLPLGGLDPRVALPVAYGLELVLAVALWFILEWFYRLRGG